MKSVFFLLDAAPYGSEKAYGVLNAAAVSIRMDITLGLYADGVYLALADQDSMRLGIPNLSDLLYSYFEITVLAHEPSLVERNLLNQGLVELVELVDDEVFLERMGKAECMIAL
jgi:tRNA 2-thiouridine synthesizing protein C